MRMRGGGRTQKKHEIESLMQPGQGEKEERKEKGEIGSRKRKSATPNLVQRTWKSKLSDKWNVEEDREDRTEHTQLTRADQQSRGLEIEHDGQRCIECQHRSTEQ